MTTPSRETLVSQVQTLRQKAIEHAGISCKFAEDGDFIMSRYEAEMAHWWNVRADHAAAMLQSYDRGTQLRRGDDWPD